MKLTGRAVRLANVIAARIQEIRELEKARNWARTEWHKCNQYQGAYGAVVQVCDEKVCSKKRALWPLLRTLQKELEDTEALGPRGKVGPR